jgi:hypothetical protein
MRKNIKGRVNSAPAFFLKGLGEVFISARDSPRRDAYATGPYPPPNSGFSYPFLALNWRTWYMKASSRVRVWVCSWPS